VVVCLGGSFGEQTRARWHEFDLDRAVWTVPAERMKAVPTSAFRRVTGHSKATLNRSAASGRYSGYRCKHIVRRQGTPDPLQLELAHQLDLYSSFDLYEHTGADQDLPRLGLVA
jgi:hypothetical protein